MPLTPLQKAVLALLAAHRSEASHFAGGVVLKNTWIAISDEAGAKMTQLADEQPDVPIGVAFVDVEGRPGWPAEDANLRVHAPSMRGCWPTLYGLEGP